MQEARVDMMSKDMTSNSGRIQDPNVQLGCWDGLRTPVPEWPRKRPVRNVITDCSMSLGKMHVAPECLHERDSKQQFSSFHIDLAAF